VAYSTRADLVLRVGGEEKLIQLASDADGNETAGLVDQAIAEADGRVSSYARKRWDVDAVPPEIQAVSARMAIRALREWKGMELAIDTEQDKRDVEWLKALAVGEVTLAPGTAKSSLVVDKAEPRDSMKKVSREKLKGFA
jgi:phage gp36-like protein